MKKIIIALAALAISVSAMAGDFGITAGITSSKTKVKDFKTSDVSLYNVGIVYKVPIGLGFAFQPGLVYQMKGSNLDVVQAGNANLSLQSKIGYLEIPFQFQWGPDLLAFRPYVFAEPFLGYGINLENELKLGGTTSETSDNFEDSAISRAEYGFSMGVGIEIWKVQLSIKKFWNFGSLKDGSGDASQIAQTISNAFKEEQNFNGLTFSAAILF